MKATLKMMLTEFVIILSGTTICAAIYCTVFNPDANLGVELLWEIIALAVFTSLPQLLFYSKRELSAKQMRIRQSIHVVLVVGLIILCAYTWGWVGFDSFIEPLAFVVLVLVTYTAITVYMYYREKKLVNMLNEKLREFRDRKEG